MLRDHWCDVFLDCNSESSNIARVCLQAVSSRPDVAPPSYTRELEKLQDQIPPFPNADAMAVIEEDTRQPIMSTFSYISPEPIAAASLGQVSPLPLPPLDASACATGSSLSNGYRVLWQSSMACAHL